MSCAKCERPFRYGTEDTVTINRKTYHADCLSCDQCSKPYDGSFLPDELDREALCRECTHTQRAKSAAGKQTNNSETKTNVNRCAGCGAPFNPSSRHITKKYQNREYHHNCLKCQKCDKLIEGEIYEDDRENKIYCTSCFRNLDQKSFQQQNQEKKRNQQKTVHFAEKLAETLNRDELESYYKNNEGRMNNDFLLGGNQSAGEITCCGVCNVPFHSGCRITQANNREYHYECFRCEFCGKPIDGTYTVSPDGRRFQCGNCLQRSYGSAASSMKLCIECGQPIDGVSGTHIEFKNRAYHAECFTCALCRRLLNPSQTYVFHDDQPWCRQCELDTKNCFNCGKSILGAGITYETRDYHAACFKCSQCQKSLENESMLCANNFKPYCVACNEELFAQRCNKCRRPIPLNTKYPVVDEKAYHDQCFLCAKCHRPIGSKKFFKDARGFICANCGTS